MMGEPVEKRGCRFGVAENFWPFAESAVCDDDHRGALIELAHEMEQQLSGQDMRPVDFAFLSFDIMRAPSLEHQHDP